MKKTNLRKITAIAITATTILAMGATVFAADTEDNYEGVGWSTTFQNVFTVSAGDDAGNLPAAIFDYEIAPGTGRAATANSPKINDGVEGATINDAVHGATGSKVTTSSVDVTASFENCEFEEAGIYRYTITETLGESNVTQDIVIDVNNDNSGSYILDVYVKRDGDEFEPYAYVMSKNDISGYDNSKDPQTVTYDENDKIDTITNEYTTYNLTISKTIKGDLAANDFAFTIALANLPTDVIFTQDGNDNTGAESYTLSATLANNGVTEIKGLPSSAKYQIQEAVNQLEGYKVEVKVNNEKDNDYSWILKDNQSNGEAEAFGKTVDTTIGKADASVAFTNTLASISPTGIILRFAPYLAILGAGLALGILLVIRKRRREDM